MVIIDLLAWWYSRGWFGRLVAVGEKTTQWADFFSFGTLLKTLFSPWRQMVVSTGPNQALNIKTNAFFDNLVSRFVGCGVRLIVFIAGVVTLIFISAFYALFVVVWPFIPIAPFALLGLGLVL